MRSGLVTSQVVQDRALGALVAVAGGGEVLQRLSHALEPRDAFVEVAHVVLRDPPDLGADTDNALTAAGFTTDEIASLRADEVVA